MNIDREKLSYGVDEAATALGITRTAIYRAMRDGDLATFKLGKRRMVSARALREFIERKEQQAAADGIAA